MIRARGQYTPRGDFGRFVETKITPGIKQGVTKWSQNVLERSQELVPVDTGELKSSGEVIPTEDTGGTVIGGARYTAAHAGYVEFGTGIRGASSAGAGPYSYSTTWPGMVAQPYLRPAYDEAKPTARSVLKDAISVTMGLG